MSTEQLRCTAFILSVFCAAAAAYAVITGAAFAFALQGRLLRFLLSVGSQLGFPIFPTSLAWQFAICNPICTLSVQCLAAAAAVAVME